MKLRIKNIFNPYDKILSKEIKQSRLYQNIIKLKNKFKPKKILIIFILLILFFYGCITILNYYYSTLNYLSKVDIKAKIDKIKIENEKDYLQIYDFKNRYFSKIIIDGKIYHKKSSFLIKEGYILFYRDSKDKKESFFIKGDSLLVENILGKFIIYSFGNILLFDNENGYIIDGESLILDFTGGLIYGNYCNLRFKEDFNITSDRLLLNFLKNRIIGKVNSKLVFFFDENYKIIKQNILFFKKYSNITILSDSFFMENNKNINLICENNSQLIFDNNFVKGQDLNITIKKNNFNFKIYNYSLNMLLNDKKYIKSDGKEFYFENLLKNNVIYFLTFKSSEIKLIDDNFKEENLKVKYSKIKLNINDTIISFISKKSFDD
jgi:hypothetical protein